jgi:formiminoglutamase
MGWKSIADLLVADVASPLAFLGAPMGQGSVSPGRCDLGPVTVRRAMTRLSTYDIVADLELGLPVRDRGDLDIAALMPGEAFDPIREAVAAATAEHALTLLVGGNNAITRPAAHGLGVPLDRVGLITFDAHFDMRDTAEGPRNGNPVRCLLEDGLPGRNICQLGLAPFANTAGMRADASAAGVGIFPIDALEADPMPLVDAVLVRLAHCERLIVDFDIDVIDRAQCPGAPGARPGGLSNRTFFALARRLAREPRVRLVDLTEFDPSLDVADITAITAARWAAEILAGFSLRD